jgi:RNA-binding protein 26
MLTEADSGLFKAWVTEKLQHISDADADVLGDYVIALLTDQPDKANCIEQLQDFLGDHTRKFVEDALAALETKSYDPSKPKPAAPTHQPPRHPSQGLSQFAAENRKRQFQDFDSGNQHAVQSYEGGDRPVKQLRRGRGGGYEPRGGRQAQNIRYVSNSPANATAPLAHHNRQYGAPPVNFQQQPVQPTPPPGMPPFDPLNPLSTFMAMSQAMGLPMPMMPRQAPATNSFGQSQSTGQRCRDYDTKGFCARGVSCPYDHGENPYVVPVTEEYDPNNATAMFSETNSTGKSDNLFSFASSGGGASGANGFDGPRGGGNGRGRVRGTFRGGSQRAPFSHMGRLNDPHATTLVVEQIPEGKFDEESVKGFFGEFGAVEEVTMQPYKRLAIVKFDNHQSADAAYNSPKSVFDNRFVKV